MNPIVFSAWNGKPPRVYVISQPLANAPDLPLSGGCTTDMSLDTYLKYLEEDMKKQKGSYYAYVKNSAGDEADTYTLETWEVYEGRNSCYEALVILYYVPLNPYLTYQKYFGEHFAQAYLNKQVLVVN